MDFASYTEIGGRSLNEDCAKIGSFPGLDCYAVCDGLGGHGRGEVASAMAVDGLMYYFGLHPTPDAAHLAEAFEQVQASLLGEQEAIGEPDSLKTTAAVLLTDDEKAIWAHVGDTRIYLFRRDGRIVRTLDHSVPQMLVGKGELRERDIRRHSDRNCLLRVMGTEWEEERYEISEPVLLAECRAFLLCTDGFWEHITGPRMRTLLRRSRTSDEWLARMFEEVRRHADPETSDNRTAIAVMF